MEKRDRELRVSLYRKSEIVLSVECFTTTLSQPIYKGRSMFLYENLN